MTQSMTKQKTITRDFFYNEELAHFSYSSRNGIFHYATMSLRMPRSLLLKLTNEFKREKFPFVSRPWETEIQLSINIDLNVTSETVIQMQNYFIANFSPSGCIYEIHLFPFPRSIRMLRLEHFCENIRWILGVAFRNFNRVRIYIPRRRNEWKCPKVNRGKNTVKTWKPGSNDSADSNLKKKKKRRNFSPRFNFSWNTRFSGRLKKGKKKNFLLFFFLIRTVKFHFIR